MKTASSILPRLLLLVTTVALLLVAGCSKPQVDPRINQFHEDAGRLIEALQRYKEFVKEYPSGDLTEIARSLSGQSQTDRILIMAASRNQLNARGELVDPWGTPLQFYFAQNGVLIRSAGPNQLFEDSHIPDSDDLYRTDPRR
jgi:hypothetical protein